jgi:uncharacterized protein YecT (DUF1311 family)
VDGVGAATRAACDAVRDLAVPEQDRPTPAEAASLKTCSSRDLYYGIGQPVDRIAARKCAILENERLADESGAISGPAVLAMIYANGDGVSRNLDLARHMSCLSSWAPAELEGRISHLDQLKTLKPGQTLPECKDPAYHYAAAYCRGAFDVCDDITSGYMGGQCTAITSDKAAAERKQRFAAMVASWPAADRAAFSALQKAATGFFESRAGNEIDMSGTLRGAFWQEERDRLMLGFEAGVVAVEQGRALGAGADLASADLALNEAWKTLRKTDLSGAGTIDLKGITATQRQWLVYRDAWAAFVHIHRPDQSIDGLKAHLSRIRTRQLKDLAGAAK